MDQPTKIDARPVLPVSDNSLWDQAAKERDGVVNLIAMEFDKRNMLVWIRKSKPGEYPMFEVVDSWRQIAQSALTTTLDKGTLTITNEVNPYNQHPMHYKVDLSCHAREFRGTHWQLSSDEIGELVNYLIEGGTKPRYFRSRVPALLRIIGLVIPFVGNKPKNKLLAEARTNYRTLPMFLSCGGLVVLMIAMIAVGVSTSGQEESDSVYGYYFLAVAVGMVSLIVAAIIAGRRRAATVVPKQSVRSPRREFRVDSWHVSVPGAGTEFEAFKDRLYNVVMSKTQETEINSELHQNLTPRGYEERERLVISRGQATLHIHIYPYSHDAFVGWESFLNWNRWEEGSAISSTVRDRRKITYRALQVGVHLPSDFDLIDESVLAETTHRILIDEIKLFLKERQIEADLDFKIIRGDRANALKEGKKEGKDAT